MDLDLTAQKATSNDVAPQYFFAIVFFIFSLFGALHSFITWFYFSFISLIFFMFSLIRTKAAMERVLIKDDIITVFNGSTIRFKSALTDIVSLDIDSYSEFTAMRGQTAIIFYLKSGDSHSVFYVNYTQRQLKEIKSCIESVSIKCHTKG